MVRMVPFVKAKRGLTLLETLLALLMLSLLIVGLLGLLGSLLVSSTKASDSSAGVYAAQYLLEQAANGDKPPSSTGGQETGIKKLLNHETRYPVDFHYQLDWTLIGDIARFESASSETRDAQFGARLFHVKATVWWSVEHAEANSHEGAGKRTVSLERTIKVGYR